MTKEVQKKRKSDLWMLALLSCVLLYLLAACGISVHEHDSEPWQYDEGYEQGYEDGKKAGRYQRREPTPVEPEEEVTRKDTLKLQVGEKQEVILRSYRQVDTEGNITVVKVNPGKKEEKITKIKGKETVVQTYFPKGVDIACYGKEPFRKKGYEVQEYLADLETPTYMHLMLSASNMDELSIIGDDESGLEQALRRSTLTFTISRIREDEQGKKEILPVKTYEIKNPMAVDIKRNDNSDFLFKVQVLPIFLDENLFSSGDYAITDIWLTYLAGKNKYRKVSGPCPLYNFEINGVEDEIVATREDPTDSPMVIVEDEDDSSEEVVIEVIEE